MCQCLRSNRADTHLRAYTFDVRAHTQPTTTHTIHKHICSHTHAHTRTERTHATHARTRTHTHASISASVCTRTGNGEQALEKWYLALAYWQRAAHTFFFDPPPPLFAFSHRQRRAGVGEVVSSADILGASCLLKKCSRVAQTLS